MADKAFDDIKWHVRTLLKDLTLAHHLAQCFDSSVPMARLGAELMRRHASRGYRDQDPATLIQMYQQHKSQKTPIKLAANLTMLFTELFLVERFEAASRFSFPTTPLYQSSRQRNGTPDYQWYSSMFPQAL